MFLIDCDTTNYQSKSEESANNMKRYYSASYVASFTKQKKLDASLASLKINKAPSQQKRAGIDS
jgi:hypothetical protein